MIRNPNDPRGDFKADAVDTVIDKAYNKVEAVYDHLHDIGVLANISEDITAVTALADDIPVVLDAVSSAQSSANASASSATAAAGSASSALASKTAAAASATSASTSSANASGAANAAAASANIASDAAATATTKSGVATTKASEASVSAAAAGTAQIAAQTARDAALAALGNLGDRYLGQFSSAPVTTVIAALYFDTTHNALMIHLGSGVWKAAYLTDPSGVTAIDIADVTNLQAALDGKQAALGFTPENIANKGQVNGYAGLDGSGKVPASQLPSFVDDVLEFANLGAFPGTGETGKIYTALDTNKVYRWGGSSYVEISASPGSTDAVPEGATNQYFTQSRTRAALSVTGVLTYNSGTGQFGINLSGYQVALGYTPVQQGTGVGQGSNTIKIGWSGTRLKATVDAVDLGNVVFDSQLTWGNISSKPFNWAGQSGQPGWVWGSNDGVNYYVWNPSNFNVNYANSAGYAANAGNADTVDGYHASELLGGNGVGTSQTWQDFTTTRSLNVAYQNTTGKPIMVAMHYNFNLQYSNAVKFQVSSNGSTWIDICWGSENATASAVIPNGHYYRLYSVDYSYIIAWAELR